MQARLLSDGHVLRVIDGDTVLARMICPCCLIQSQQRIRLARIDAPELRGPSIAAAIDSKEHLRTLCEGKAVKLAVCRTWPDLHGRVISEMLVDGRNMSDEMLHSGHAVLWRKRKGEGDTAPLALPR